MIRILIADDHAATRRSISLFLTRQDGFTICGEAADGVQAVEQSRNLSPDVIVMDVSMPKMDGLTAATIIRRENPLAQIVLISLEDQPNLNYGLVFIDKANLADDLIPAMRRLTK